MDSGASGIRTRTAGGFLPAKTSKFIKKVTLKDMKAAQMGEFYSELENILDEMKPHTITADTIGLRGIKLMNHPQGKAAELQFMKPDELEAVGSYVTATSLKEGCVFDIAVRMPSECFLTKDYLNGKYFDKRAMYLSAIAKELMNSKHKELISDVKLDCFANHTSKSVLILTPAKKEISNIKVKLIPTIYPSTFELSKLRALRNNFRRVSHGEEPQKATPHHSQAIIEDMMIDQHKEYLLETVQSHPIVKPTIVLAKCWLRAHNLEELFSPFLTSMLIAHLAKSNDIKRDMEPYQAFLVLMRFLVHTDLSKGVKMANLSSVSPIEAEEFELMVTLFDCTLVDPTQQCNLASRVSRVALKEVRRLAKVSIEYLTNNSGETDICQGFDEVFVTQSPIITRVDHAVWVSIPGKPDDDSPVAIMDGVCDLPWAEVFVRRMSGIVSQALAARTHDVMYRMYHTKTMWKPTEKVPSTHRMLLGISINPETAFKIVERGPQANNADKAREFREIWGSKSELRRFKDGGIVEAVVFEGIDRLQVPSHMLKYLADTHGVEGGNHIVSQPGTTADAVEIDERFQFCDLQFNELKRQLIGLKLPLKIKTVLSTDCSSYNASLVPPMPHPLGGKISLPSGVKTLPKVVHPINVMIKMDNSNKWPDSIEAVKATKTAFLLRIGQELTRTDESIEVTNTKDHLIVMKGGLFFKIRLFAQREVNLLRNPRCAAGVKLPPAHILRRLKLAGADPDAADEIDLNLTTSGELTTALRSLALAQPVFCHVLRLVKLWISKHMFGRFLNEELLGLLVAQLFSRKNEVPQSPLAGLLQFFRLVASHDWANSPLIVNINDKIVGEDRPRILASFRKHRSQNPNNPAMYVVTPMDRISEWRPCGYCLNNPSKLMLNRLIQFANASQKVVLQWIAAPRSKGKGEVTADGGIPCWGALFNSPLAGYNAIIHLRPLVARSCQPKILSDMLNGSFKKKQLKTIKPFTVRVEHKNLLSSARKELLVGFNPFKMFLSEIEEKFSSQGIFFIDEIFGDKICVSWKPNAFKKKKKNQLSVEEVLGSIEAIGEGLVDYVEQQ
eukprot:TRINITY_DN775917_c0_g1_i1.p1 TRINITY_DN775917_c0_g1~~TRINITY_DN775917_c0_g1_i1.p1  ORF type:complete len:1070 (-),score=376.86 TRINITY_DN775917_c0_g1_i1:150-3359(-)